MKKFILIPFLLMTILVQAQVGVGTNTPKSTLDINGSISNKVNTITASTLLDISNAVVLCNNTVPITVTLPSASSIDGRLYTIKRVNTASVLISPLAGQTIDGAVSVSLSAQFDQLQVISNGSNWYILNTKAATPVTAHYIGESFGGGIIFYLDASGTHGLIAAPADQTDNVKWNNAGGLEAKKAQLQGLYTGQANTEFIVDANPGPEPYAASVCYNLVLNTYSDWYLPSVEELTLMYRNLHLQGLGGFSAGSAYWSSTAFDANNQYAYAKYFSATGQLAAFDILDTYRARAIRAF